MRNTIHEPVANDGYVSNTRWDALSDQLSYFSVTINDDAALLSSQMATHPIVIVGAGPSGQELAALLSKHSDKNIVLINGESYLPYMRAQISTCIAEGKSLQALMANRKIQTDTKPVLTINGSYVTEIDREHKTITLNNGASLPYESLVLATGSRPTQLDVFSELKNRALSFRDLKDIERLVELSPNRVVVVGGGLLGIEAARAVRPFCDHVQILERFPHLLPRQLDQAAATRLQDLLLTMGIEVKTNAKIVRASEQTTSVTIMLSEQEAIHADVVIYATGVNPNVSLAAKTGLDVGRAICVDRHYRTSDPNIYAIGECCEQSGITYASLSPCVRHAQQLASVLTGAEEKIVSDTDLFQLKVGQHTIASIGNTKAIDASQHVYQSASGAYRRIFIEENVVVGAIVFEAANVDFSELAQAVQLKSIITPDQLDNFYANGTLSLANACASRTICYCAQVTAEKITQLSTQNYSRSDIVNLTGASSYCGSCAPRLDELLKQPSKDSSRATVLSAISITLIALTLAVLGMTTPLADSWQSIYRHVDVLWRDSIFRQISGYLLFVTMILSAWWGLRRRHNRLSNTRSKLTLKGHAAIGAVAVSMWFMHTGGRMGYELNFWLFLSFVAVLIVGSVSALLWVLAAKRERARLAMPWLRQAHWLALFPLPALLLFHIVKTYYF